MNLQRNKKPQNCFYNSGMFLERGIKFDHTGKIRLVGMALGNAADQFEGTEGVEAEAAVLADDLRIVLGNGFGDGRDVALLFRTVGVQEENRLAVGQVLFGKL